MPIRRALLLLLPLAIAACEDLPTEVASEAPVVATDLGLRARVPSYARATLLREALRAVAREGGAAALWRRTAELRAYDAAARSARDAGDTPGQIAAETSRQRAEAALIADVLGDARLDDVQRDVRIAARNLERVLADARERGYNVTRADALLAEAQRTLSAAARANTTRLQALATALQSADLIQRAQQLVDAVSRVHTLDDLFAEVLADVRQANGADAARALLAEYQTYVREAEQAMAGGDRERAHDRLRRVRGEQLRIISQRLGRDGVAEYVREVAAAEAASTITDRRQRGLAREHVIEAEQALREDDLFAALERATIAAELLSVLPIAPQ